MRLAEINAVLAKRRRINPLEFLKLLPIQQSFVDCVARIKALFGGNRSGKTEAGAAYVIKKCLEKKIRVWACAETIRKSIDIQQRKIWALLPKDQVRYAYYDEINGFRHNKIVFKNGSIITFKSYEQGRGAFESDDIDLIWNDEEPLYEIYREQRMRLLDRRGEMIFTMTSLEGMTELMSDLFEEHDVVKTEHSPLLNETLPRVVQKNGVMFFMMWTTENPHIDQETVLEDVKVMSREEIRSRIHGIPTNLSGRIYPMFNKLIHVVSEDMLPTRLVTLYNVLDPHDRKPWALTWWAVTKTGRAYCIREYPWQRNFNDVEFDDKSYDDYAALIKGVENELFDQYGRYIHKRIIDPNFGHSTVRLAKRADGQSKTTTIKELAKRGLRYDDGIDSLEEGHIQVRKWLHWVEKDGEIVVQPKLFVYEKCENMVRHLSRYSHKDLEAADGDDKAKPQLTQKWKDYADNARYFVMSNPHYVETKARTMIESPKRY